MKLYHSFQKREEFVVKKVLKFILPVMLLVVALVALSACSNDDNGDAPAAELEVEVTPDPQPEPEQEVEEPAEEYEEYEEPADETSEASWVRVALVAHSPDSILDDGSFNEGAWQGIQNFLASNGLPVGRGDNAEFFQPHEASDDARIDLIMDAINWGANILVMPGFHFESSLYVAQDMFPDTKFVLLDASPTRVEEEEVDGEMVQVRHIRHESNLAAIHYAEHEAGFLAGYAVVMDGLRDLGFMGGIAVPAVIRFGHGFIQGAEHAAASLGLDTGEVTINFQYLGGFAPDPGHAVTASGWFAGGTEVIFAAAGGAGFSVISGAEGSEGLVVGVDVDQADASDVVITSAMKALDVSVYDMLTDFLNGSFRGGAALTFDATVNGIGLPMATSRFNDFTQAQYDAIFAELASGAIVVNSSLDLEDILAALSLVTVNEM